MFNIKNPYLHTQFKTKYIFLHHNKLPHTMKALIPFAFIIAIIFSSCDTTPDSVTDRYLFRISADNKVEIEKKNYESDSLAISTERANYIRQREILFEEYDKLVRDRFDKNKEQYSDIEYKARESAYSEMMKEKWLLLFITHSSAVNSEDVLKFVKKNGNDLNKLKEYAVENGFDISMAEI